MIYLVTGATGTIGSLVVEELIRRGDRPRVFVRDEDKARSLYGNRVDVFTGDLGETATLKPALRGADALLLVNAGPDLAARDEAAAHAAKSEGVKRLVKISSYDAGQNVGTGVWHAQGEKAIRASGLPFTFVQPSGFMSNVLFWATSIKAEGTVLAATAEGKIPFIHPQDIADVATMALTSRDYDGMSLPITGPEALSYAEMTERIGAAIGKRLTFTPISEEQVRRRMIDDNAPEDVIDAHLSIYRAIRVGRLAAVTDTVERVLGRKAIRFEQWIQENAAVFVEAACAC
jgi:(4-alkanoyl-5-oxo-2,5-dihydrofuran-3-yl)methyl phosphate reductase